MITGDMTQRAISHPFFAELLDEIFTRKLTEHPPTAALRLAEIEAVGWMHDDLELSQDEWDAKWEGPANRTAR